MFLALNGQELVVNADEAVEFMLTIAAGDLDEAGAAAWLTDRLEAG